MLRPSCVGSQFLATSISPIVSFIIFKSTCDLTVTLPPPKKNGLMTSTGVVTYGMKTKPLNTVWDVTIWCHF